MAASWPKSRSAGRRHRRHPHRHRLSGDIFLKAFVTGFPSAARLGHRHQLLNFLVERMALGDDLIDDAEGSGILRRQKVVAVERLLDRLIGLPGMAHIDVVQTPFHLDDVLGVALDVTRLTLETARRLMQQDAGVGQRIAHALLTRRKQKRAHGRGLTDAKGGDGRPDELHRVVDRHAGGDDAPRRVDVHGDLFLRAIRLQKEQLRRDQRGDLVFDRARDKDDALLQQARIDVIGPLAAVGLLDHHGHQRVQVDLAKSFIAVPKGQMGRKPPLGGRCGDP